ncbi:hypothetical protein PCASD_12535 [Puccinia coronata f. sp. avenae]|uniref:Protein aurora borealis n=1 Tax=Puccinia coronata f. sp. avenae TaxID=200324 RepID=A0A2N5TBX3_9BASI|nr:hypothetical protein PCASD_12535 [Puccinia coronata f. sp. avenae]
MWIALPNLCTKKKFLLRLLSAYFYPVKRSEDKARIQKGCPPTKTTQKDRPLIRLIAMSPFIGESTTLNYQESYQYLLMTDAGPEDGNSSLHMDTASIQNLPDSADYSVSGGKANIPILCDLLTDSNAPSVRSHRLPFDLRFTPVNSPTDNTGPAKPNLSDKIFLRPSMSQNHSYARHCRLIGFTPLTEDAPASSEEDPPQFLGPRKVKAKEVAPCALFYKRSDVFVSSEMKSQNVLAYSENHYRNLRFDDEISVSEIEYASQSPNQGCEGSQEATNPTIIAEPSQFKTFEAAKEIGAMIQLEPLCTDRKDGLTTMPLASELGSGAHWNNDCFHIFVDETDSPLTAVSGAEKRAPWESPCKLFNSDLEQSVSSISSSGIQSGLWESTLSSLTRATSPVSSIYSNVVPTCDQQFLKESLTEEKYAKSQQCKMMEFSHFTMNADNQPLKSSMNTGEYDWEEDHGSLADDENNSDCSSSQLDSDDDHEASQYARNCFDLIASPSLTGLTKKGEAVIVNKSGQPTGSRVLNSFSA